MESSRRSEKKNNHARAVKILEVKTFTCSIKKIGEKNSIILAHRNTGNSNFP